MFALVATAAAAQQPAQLRCGEHLLMIDYPGNRMTVDVIDKAGKILRPSEQQKLVMTVTDSRAMAVRGSRVDWDRFTLDHQSNVFTRENDAGERWTQSCIPHQP